MLNVDNLINNVFLKKKRDLALGLSNEIFRIELYQEENIGLDAIIGYQNIKNLLMQTAEDILNNKDRLNKYNLEVPNGVLLYGPPGNGKTHMIKSLANEYKMDFLLISSDVLMRGNSPINSINMIIDNCAKLSPMGGLLVFFDEFDAIANQNIASSFRATMLKGIERLRELPNILLCGATNFYGILDEATIRSGRFDIKIELRNPTIEEKKEIMISFLNDEFFEANSNNIYNLASQWFEMQKLNSISDIKTYCNNLKREIVLGRVDSNLVEIIEI